MRPMILLMMVLAACSASDDVDTSCCDDTEVTEDSGCPEPCGDDTGADTVDTTDTVDPLDVDDDGDGFTENEGDCDDTKPGINPWATDIIGDGLDQNCDGIDGTDSDSDGRASIASGGDDCDDGEAGTNPLAPDVSQDGVDQNCDGADGTDGDGDGFANYATGGKDCNDTDPSFHPGAPDVVEAVEDDLYLRDQNCDGIDGTDDDGDGFASVETGGDDCDDEDEATCPSCEEVWYDGVDQNCDEANDFDQDGDAWSVSNPDPRYDDCDDTDPATYPGAKELPDGIDQDCKGDMDGLQVYVYWEPCDDAVTQTWFGLCTWMLSVNFYGGTDPKGFDFGLHDGSYRGEDCLTGECHSVSGTSELYATPDDATFAHWAAEGLHVEHTELVPVVEEGEGWHYGTAWSAGTMTWVVRLRSNPVCYTWGPGAAEYVADGCIEQTPYGHGW